MAYLTRDEILGAEDRKPVTVAVPEWGGEVLVQPMDGARRIQFEQAFSEQPDLFRAYLVVFTVVNATGELEFRAKDAQALWEKAYSAVLRISKVSAPLSGVNLGAREAARENFTETPGERSPSA